MAYNPEIWGPHFWFFLQCAAIHYPRNPPEMLKKKYYNLFENLPLFIPHEKIGDDLIKLFDEYPVGPYLDSKESLLKYIHFIHNKINTKIGKPIVSYEEAMKDFYDSFKPKEHLDELKKRNYQRIGYGILIGFLVVLAYTTYKHL